MKIEESQNSMDSSRNLTHTATKDRLAFETLKVGYRGLRAKKCSPMNQGTLQKTLL